MKFNLSYIYIFVFLFSCTQDMKIIKKHPKVIEPTYSSKGFALIYEDSIFESNIVNKKLNNNQNYVLHSFLKNDTLVSISNPFNSKSLTAKVRKTILTVGAVAILVNQIGRYISNGKLTD